MQAHKIQAVVPDDHRVTIEFPDTIPSGPVELIVLVPPQEAVAEHSAETVNARLERLQKLVSDLEGDPRPMRELATEERQARLRQLRGAFRGMTSGSEEFARLKREEVELEVAKSVR